jgi:hypothetical protein
MNQEANYAPRLEVALTEAHQGLAEGGIPVGGATFDHALFSFRPCQKNHKRPALKYTR